MRPALLAGLVVAVAPAIGFAQSGPYFVTVTDPEVRLRAGPSDQFPETTALKKGDRLIVYKDESNGWLAVQDPPGTLRSISWVQTQFIEINLSKPIPQPGMVTDPTTLRAGQMGLAEPLPIRRAEVPAGTILTVIGPKAMFDGKGWFPVVPPADDFRYLPKQSVTFDKPANTSFTVRDNIPAPAAIPPVTPAGGTAPAAAIPGVGPTSPASPPATGGRPAVQNPLWAQAEAAERDGKYDEAERLFFQLARLMNEPGGDHDIANLCYTRIHTLREKKRAAAGGGASSPTRTTGSSGTTTGTTSGGTPPPASSGRDDGPRWNGPGILKLSNLTIAGPRSYRLESSNGESQMFVVPGQGVDLERLVNKKVNVYGASYTRQGLTKPYVVATAVEPAQ